MDKFLETCNFSRLNLTDIKSLNRTIMSKEIEFIIKNFLTKKVPEPGGFTDEFYQILKEELMSILLNSSKKLKKREHFQIDFLRPTLDPHAYRYEHYLEKAETDVYFTHSEDSNSFVLFFF